MPRGKYVNHKGRARHFTSPDELEQERKKLELKKWKKKQAGEDEDGSDAEEEDEEVAGAAGGKPKEKDGSDEESEEDSDEEDDQGKPKGVQGLIEIENPNRVVKKEKKLSKLGMPDEATEAPKPELSRREREELERQRAKAHYQKLHAEGKTEQARADLARLAIIRKQREDAAAKREEEKKSKEVAKTAKTDELGKALGKKS